MTQVRAPEPRQRRELQDGLVGRHEHAPLARGRDLRDVHRAAQRANSHTEAIQASPDFKSDNAVLEVGELEGGAEEVECGSEEEAASAAEARAEGDG